eukprot:Pgem_evm1s10047
MLIVYVFNLGFKNILCASSFPNSNANEAHMLSLPPKIFSNPVSKTKREREKERISSSSYGSSSDSSSDDC